VENEYLKVELKCNNSKDIKADEGVSWSHLHLSCYRISSPVLTFCCFISSTQTQQTLEIRNKINPNLGFISREISMTNTVLSNQ